MAKTYVDARALRRKILMTGKDTLPVDEVLAIISSLKGKDFKQEIHNAELKGYLTGSVDTYLHIEDSLHDERRLISNLKDKKFGVSLRM